MKPSACLCFVQLFITLSWIDTNRITGFHQDHVKQLFNQVGFLTKGQESENNGNRQFRTERDHTMDDVESWKTKRDSSHLQTNNGSNTTPCEGTKCIWITKDNFRSKRSLNLMASRYRRRESVFLAKALDMLDHARPREYGNFATRATPNKPFKPITTTNKNISKQHVKNSTLVNKATKNQQGDKRQEWSDTTGEMRPRFFFNSAPAEYVEQKPPSLRRTESGPIHLALPPVARAGPHVPLHLHRMAKHPVHFPQFPINVVGSPLSQHPPPHFHNHQNRHQLGPPPYAIHIHAPPKLEPPFPPPNLMPQNIPPMPETPPDMLGETMPPLNPPLGTEPPHLPPNDDAPMPGDLHMLPPEGIPMQPPPINLPEGPSPEDLSPVLHPRPALGMEPPPPVAQMMPPPDIPIHTHHPIDVPIGAPSDLHIMPPHGIPMSPSDFDLQGISLPGEVPPMPPPHQIQHVPVPVPVPSPPKIEHVPYPIPVPGPPSIQPVVVPVRVPSPPKIQQVPVPVESPPKIQNVPVPVPVAVPSPPQIKQVPYPVALPVKEPGEIQRIFYPIAVPQPSQVDHVPFPVYVRYPPEIRRVPYPVPLPPKPYPVPVPSPPHLVVHRVPYPVMFPQKVPYPIPVVVQHHHINEDIGVGGESVSNGQCLVNLCLNGGTCSAYMNTYRCHCPNGFQGKHCEEQNMCKPNPCKNFGTCSQVEHDYECTCSRGFIGKNCDRPDPCIPSPCENGATCSSDGSSYSCTCRMGWIGKNCQVESKCLPINPCQNGGTCTEAQGKYQCDCTPGWSGLSCEVSAPETLHQKVICDNCHTSDDFIEQRNKLRHRLTTIKKWQVAKG